MLANRHIGNTSGCPVCNAGCEDIKHILFSCDKAKGVWKILGVWEQILESFHVDRSGSVILEELIRRGDQVQLLENIGLPELVLIGGWYLWWERRQLVRGEQVQTVAKVAMAIAALALNYSRAPKKMQVQNKRWKRPPEGRIAINVDATFSMESGTGATGVIIRDHTGSCIAAANRFLDHVGDVPMAEALALRDGLRLAQQIGSNNIIIQSDCLMVVDTMKDGGFSATSAAPIFDECQVLRSDFVSCAIEYCNRETNEVAHLLARTSLAEKASCTWADEPPSFIVAALADDVSLVFNE